MSVAGDRSSFSSSSSVFSIEIRVLLSLVTGGQSRVGGRYVTRSHHGRRVRNAILARQSPGAAQTALATGRPANHDPGHRRSPAGIGAFRPRDDRDQRSADRTDCAATAGRSPPVDPGRTLQTGHGSVYRPVRRLDSSPRSRGHDAGQSGRSCDSTGGGLSGGRPGRGEHRRAAARLPGHVRHQTHLSRGDVRLH
jgi:hypothetical protein